MAKATVVLPQLHAGQLRLYAHQRRLNAVRCGRRWGKTRFLEWLAENGAARGASVGIFAPEHKQLAEPWDRLIDVLSPIIKGANKNDATIKIKGGGKIDFWALNDNELAGRGREYDLVLGDEMGFTKTPQMNDIWFKSVKPTMLTTKGIAWVFSTPNGLDTDNFFYNACRNPEFGFQEFHAPTITNPYVEKAELDKEQLRNHPLVFRQEYMAEFIDWSGVAFFTEDKMLLDGKPAEYPTKCDGVFAVIDTAIKGGREHDGTAVVYCAVNQHYGTPLTILDWDVVQIDGASLELWMPSVFMRLEDLAKQTGARHGVIGTWLEDAAAGTILLQQGVNNGWNTHSIDSKLTALGKDERAFSVSGYFYQSKMKISEYAYDKQVPFKGTVKNHLLSQLFGFRIGDKDAHKRSDDLLDCVVYALAIAFGNNHGF